MLRPSHHRIAIALIALFVAVGVLYSVVVPIFEAPDELYHFPFVAHMAQGGALPVQRPNRGMMWQQEGSQPPLYYFLAGALTSWIDTSDLPDLYRVNPHARVGIPLAHDNKNIAIHTARERWPWTGAVLSLHLVRLFSLALAAGTLVCTYRIALTIFPHAPIIAVAALAVNAFIPMFVFISASVNNDNLVIFLSSVTLLLLVRIVQRGASRWRLVSLGAVIGLACLTKLSALGLIPLTGLTLLLHVGPGSPLDRRTKLKRWVMDCVVFCLPAVLIAGWWYLRNWQLYGDPTGLNAMLDIVGRRPETPALVDLFGEFEGLRINFWGLFGVVNVLLRPTWIYRILDAMTVLAAAGSAVWVWRQRRTREPIPWRELTVLAAWATMEFVLLIRWTSMTYASQGRLLFPAIAAMALFLALGLVGWAASQWRIKLASGLSVFFFVLSVTAPLTAIRPTYAQPTILTAATVPPTAKRFDVTYGDTARLLAFEVGMGAVRAGEAVPVTLYWEALRPTAEDLSIYLQLVTGQDHILGQVDSYPGGGAYPTSMWSPGQVIRDEYWIPITSAPRDPVAAQLQVGLYQHRTHQRLAAMDARGQTLNPPILERVKISVPTLPSRPAQALEANLDNRVQLIGYDLPTRSVQAGAEVTLTLFWRVTGELSLDYTVMLHLLDVDDRLVGQGDGPPRNNTYPTSFWAPGETLTDRHSMRVFDQTKPGKYRVAVGLYDPTTEQRLPVLDMQGNVIGDRAFVGVLEVLGP